MTTTTSAAFNAKLIDEFRPGQPPRTCATTGATWSMRRTAERRDTSAGTTTSGRSRTLAEFARGYRSVR